MNKILFEKGKTLNILRRYASSIECNKNAMVSLRETREKLIQERDSLLNINNAPLLFYFYYEKDINLIDPNDFYNNYYYDYKTEAISTTTSSHEPINGYGSAVDITAFFSDTDVEESFDKIISIINKFVDYLINEFNPETWEELTILVNESIKNGEFELINKEAKLVK